MYPQNPYYSHHYYPMYSHPSELKHETLSTTAPAVEHGLKEAQKTSYQHALQEAAAISYLMGKGYNYPTAWQMVESWWRRGDSNE
jgi:hypothetical protein